MEEEMYFPRRKDIEDIIKSVDLIKDSLEKLKDNMEDDFYENLDSRDRLRTGL